MAADNSLLTVTNLSVSIGNTQIVNDISFSIAKGECIGVVGESGSGKSTMALSLVGMVGNGRDATIDGEIVLEGRRIDGLTNKYLRNIRGKEIAVILQDPMSSLNPVFSIGNQLGEALTAHGSSDVAGKNASKEGVTGSGLQQAKINALAAVHIPAAEQRLRDYPHQMSGGMRQRIVGAIGMAAKPQLLIADEPTTSLDATLQVQYLQLLKELQNEAVNTDRPLSILLITHDFGAVAKCCDSVCVMYAGRIVEYAQVHALFNQPAHPYTQALMESRPQIGCKKNKLPSIAGFPPRPGDKIVGCAFAPRCPKAQEKCKTDSPSLKAIATDKVSQESTTEAGTRQVACWFPNVETVQ